MIEDINRKIGIDILSNIENNPRRQGKKHVKIISLHLGKVLNSLENLTQEENKQVIEDLQEDPQQVENKPK
ncbi:hypothetical protein J1N35_043598 [Gossypium stocksii]|uniref:Uncharacterized protein n=1 Tax=Gossypium stocksii TaxID=47602 RepID=A0A9D3U7K2_9ROSI|nr:hypothetical protein J1N35_043598 [Gossypium stocksii]